MERPSPLEAELASPLEAFELRDRSPMVTMKPDPFDILGVPAKLEQDEQQLEQIYLRLSRACHPDFHGDADPMQQAAILSRAADLNHAYRTLAHPWKRAEALLERTEPGVLERTKTLDPMFLSDAMDLAEEVGTANSGNRATLQQRIERTLADAFDQLRHAHQEGRIEAAATVFHQARYYQKALSDLRLQEHETP